MRLMLTFLRRYPWQTLLTLLALLFAGIAEGLGLTALLPLLEIANRSDAGLPAAAAQASAQQDTAYSLYNLLHGVGIEPGVGIMLAVIVAGVTVKNLLLLVARRQVGYTAARVATDLRLNLLRAILRSRWEYFLDQPIGKLANALASEAQRASETFINGATVITFLIQTAIYGAVAIAVSWQATLASLAAGAVIIVASHFLVRMAQRAGRRQTGLMNSLLARLTDTLQSVKPLKAMGREHLADRVLAIETAGLDKALRRQVFSGAALTAGQDEMFTIVIALGMFAALVPLDMPLATVVVLVLILGRMLAQFGKAHRQYQRVAVGESAFWSMQAAIDAARAAEEHCIGGALPTLRQSIRLQAVRFAYAQRNILDGITLDIPAGELVTLTGRSGAGKTTVVDLVIGLLQPQAGCITVDGIALPQLDHLAWRRMIGYVPQDTLLLHDSVLHNVTLGDPDLDEADAERALRAVGAWDFLSQLPDGIHTPVGERGSRLSGGQRQRIVIARALVRRPALLILDEATSALDPDSEAAICRVVHALRGSLTILAISHRQALIDAADRVYRLDQGKAEPVLQSARILRAAGSGALQS
ncbi:MAG: ABC transporter ATP-binding protein [Thiogranum sp.]|nr:ABC transporter ATP-binding protein [Thiogranum sp.]